MMVDQESLSSKGKETFKILQTKKKKRVKRKLSMYPTCKRALEIYSARPTVVK
jgi:hypothetical protein